MSTFKYQFNCDSSNQVFATLNQFKPLEWQKQDFADQKPTLQLIAASSSQTCSKWQNAASQANSVSSLAATSDNGRTSATRAVSCSSIPRLNSVLSATVHPLSTLQQTTNYNNNNYYYY